MDLNQQLAKHLKEVHTGGNWTCVNVRDVLGDVTWQQAITQVADLNTIATLTFHINYFIGVVCSALKTNELVGNDSLSFAHPPIDGPEDWDRLRNKVLTDVEELCRLVSELPDDRAGQVFFNEQYGSYFRNIVGLIEHTHYHLGQIVIIKKVVQTGLV